VPARVKTTGEGAFPRRLMSLVDNRVRIGDPTVNPTEPRGKSPRARSGSAWNRQFRTQPESASLSCRPE
jgi:hypothetical protein